MNKPSDTVSPSCATMSCSSVARAGRAREMGPLGHQEVGDVRRLGQVVDLGQRALQGRERRGCH
jgi:hypothetical protein